MGIRAAELEIIVTAETSQAKAELASVSSQIAHGVGGFLAGEGLQRFGEGALDFFGSMIDAGARFNQQMTFVNSIIGGTIDNLEALKQKAVEVDINTIFNALEVGQGMEQLAREGFSAMEIIGTPGQKDGLIDAVLNFAAAVDTNVPEAGNIFGNVMRIFQSEGITGAEVSDILTAAILRSGRSASEFATGMQYIGSIANELGVPLEDTAVALSFLTREGIKARSAGTGLRSMFLALADPTGGAAAAMNANGIAAWDLQGNFIGLIPLIDQFHNAIKDMSDKDALKFISDIFGKNASSPLLTLFRGGVEAMDETKDSMDDLGTAADVMDARMNTLQGSIDILSSSWFTFKKILGDSIADEAKPVIDFLSVLLQILMQAPDSVHKAIAVFTLFAGVLATVAGSLMIFNAVGGMSVLMAALGGIVSLGATVVGVLFGVAAALALLSLAWKFNLFGIRELMPTMTTLRTFLDTLTNSFTILREAGFNPVSSALYALANAFDAVGASGIAGFVRDLGNLATYLISVAEGGRVTGAMLDTLPGKWRLVGSFVGLVTKTIRDFITAIGDGEFGKAFTGLGNNLTLIGHFFERLWEDQIKPGIDRIDWGNVATSIISGIETALSTVATYAFKLGKLLLEIGGWAISTLVSAVTAIYNYVTGRTPDETGGPGGASLLVKIGTILLEGVLALADTIWGATKGLASWLESKLKEGWNNASVPLGAIVLTVIPSLAKDFYGEAADFASWLKAQIIAGWDGIVDIGEVAVTGDPNAGDGEGGGSSFGLAVRDAVVASVEAVSSLGSDVANKVWSFITDFSWVSVITVDSFNAGSDFGTAIHDAIVGAVTAGIELITVDNLSAAAQAAIDVVVAGLVGAMALPAAMLALATAVGSFLLGAVAGLVFGEDNGADFNSAIVKLSDGLISAVTETSFTAVGLKIAGAIWSGIKSGLRALMPQVIEDYVFGGETTYAAPKDIFAGAQNAAGQSGGSGLIANSEHGLPQGAGSLYHGRMLLELDTSKYDIKFNGTKGDLSNWIKDKHEATISGNNGPFAIAYSDAFKWGTVFAAQTFTAKLAGNTGPFATAYTAVFGWGATFARQTFTATFAGDNGPAAVAYTNAFGWGNIWADQVFTATFAINTNPLLTALTVVRAVVQEISDLLPHSPAKKGPLARPISFGYVADDLSRTMSDMGGIVTQGMQTISKRLAAPVEMAAAPASGSARFAAAPSGNVTNIFHVTVPAADFPEWIETVQFVQDLDTSRQNTLGVA